jgi:LysM repeat protein
MSRKRRKPKPGIAHYAAPVAFLAGVTIAVLLVHSALDHNHQTTTTLTTAVATQLTGTSPAKPSTARKRFYVVQTGDTFGTIASKEGITVGQLQALNPKISSNALQVGQKLRVK